MKARKLLSVFCSAALISTCAMSPLSSLTAYADQTLVDVPLQEIEKQNGNITEIISVGGYTELRPDTADIPEMPDVLKNRESKHHVFERREDHSINFRGELIMPGDTFEIRPTFWDGEMQRLTRRTEKPRCTSVSSAPRITA